MSSIQKTTKEVLIGMAAYLLIASIPVLIFTSDKLKGEGGLILGGIIAIAMLFSMRWSITKAVHTNRSSVYMGTVSVLRMLLIAGILAAIGWFEILNLITTFVGIFSLKFATYVQPLTEKLINKKIR